MPQVPALRVCASDGEILPPVAPGRPNRDAAARAVAAMRAKIGGAVVETTPPDSARSASLPLRRTIDPDQVATHVIDRLAPTLQRIADQPDHASGKVRVDHATINADGSRSATRVELDIYIWPRR